MVGRGTDVGGAVMEGGGGVGPYSVGVKGWFFANERAQGSLEC